MGFVNPSFEDPGEAPGHAAGWTLVTFVQTERIAGFGPEPHRAWEGFERWFELERQLLPGRAARGFFDGDVTGQEGFVVGWGVDGYVFELPSVAAAVFGGRPVEAMEAGWGNDDYATGWHQVASVQATFAGQVHESFGWPHPYARSWGAVASLAAQFDDESQASESFSSGWAQTQTI